MPNLSLRSARPARYANAFSRALVTLAVITSMTACNKTDRAAVNTDSAGGAMAAGAGSDSMAAHNMAGMSDSANKMSGMAGMPGMTGNADQDFLRMMSDHHTGLAAMAQLSIEGDKKGSSSVRSDAKKMNAKQGKEIEEMVAMLKRDFNDAYAPKLTPDNQAMVDQLKAQTGVAYNKLFYENVVKHHQQAMQMIDQSMPRMQRADLKTMAERMKREQAAEIAELQRKGPGA